MREVLLPSLALCYRWGHRGTVRWSVFPRAAAREWQSLNSNLSRRSPEFMVVTTKLERLFEGKKERMKKMKGTSSHTKTPSSLKRKPTCSPKESTKNTKNPGNRHAHRQSLNRMCWKVLWDIQRFHKLWFLTLVLLQLSLLKWNHLLLQFAVWAPFLQIIEVIVSCDQIPLL